MVADWKRYLKDLYIVIIFFNASSPNTAPLYNKYKEIKIKMHILREWSRIQVIIGW
jgi:hypothetical protein